MTQADLAGNIGLYTKERFAVFAAASAAAILGSKFLPSDWPVAPLALAAIAIAIWHGAFDGVLAREALEPRWGSHWSWVFLPTYLALTMGVLVLWYIAPAIALLGFLAYSALHFGTESDPHLTPLRIVLGLATGFLPIAAACHWSAAPAQAIFTQMLRGDSVHGTAVVSMVGRFLWPLVAVTVAASAWTARVGGGFGLALVAVELVLFRYCSPLGAFAVFFCLWHTPEHMVSTSRGQDGRFDGQKLRSHLWAGLAPWAASLAAVVVACWFGRHTMLAYTGTVFICLSALTVPHMALGELCRAKGGSVLRDATLHEASARL